MWPFKCVHPFDSLVVEKDATVKSYDADFNKVTYHFICTSCGKKVDLPYVRFANSVEDFLKKGE